MKILVLALAVLAVPVAAQAAAKHHHRHVSQAARSSYAAQPEIACSQVGCAPVPRGCHRAAGRTFGGDPTGFDIADCGNYTIYGNK